MAIHDDVHAILATILARPNQPIDQRLAEALRLLGKWRSEEIGRAWLGAGTPAVRRGPFTGMRYLPEPAEGSWLPKIFGTYEQELHRVIETLPARGYAQVVNVGCAEGFYAVGLARMLDIDVLAFDISERAQALCRALAERNGVSARVHVGGALTPSVLEDLEGKTFLLCDIEGAEREVLDPRQAPSLAAMDILVEVHESLVPGVGALLEERFDATHSVERIAAGDRSMAMPAEVFGWDNLDQLLAIWEWRLADPGWLWLKAR